MKLDLEHDLLKRLQTTIMDLYTMSVDDNNKELCDFLNKWTKNIEKWTCEGGQICDSEWDLFLERLNANYYFHDPEDRAQAIEDAPNTYKSFLQRTKPNAKPFQLRD